MFPAWVEALAQLGGIYLAAGDSTATWEFYDRLVQRAPRSAEAHYYRGATLAYRGLEAQAIQEFQTSRALNPNFAYAYDDEFAALWDMGRREEAIGVLQQWVGSHPEDAERAAKLAQARAMIGQTPATPPGWVPPRLR